MSRSLISTAALLALAGLAVAQDYKLGPDSYRQPGVPQGRVTRHTWTASKIYPGTVRDYWIYVPAQYRADRPACVMVFQDGHRYAPEAEAERWRTPIVFDNLIHKGQMPVTIGVFIAPGALPARTPEETDRVNRSFEYDAVDDRYARFLVEEILSEVGKQYNLSSDPNDRGIGGLSSGAIASLAAAWNRPDAFRRVLSFYGSHTNLRGGQVFISLIRKSEPKPIRIFVQDGRNDLNNFAGNWYIANQDLVSSLEFAGYDHTFVVGDGAHDNIHSSSIFPDALRWLWRDYPKPIAKPRPANPGFPVNRLLDHGQEWEVVSTGHKFTEGPAVDREGNVFFTDIPNNRIHKIGRDGKVSVFQEDTGGANGLMFGPDGRLYACQNGRRRIVAYGPDGTESVVAEDVNSNDLAVNKKGEIYFSDPNNRRVWFIDAKGAKRVVHEGIERPNGVVLSPDQAFLIVNDSRGRFMWSFQVQPDGSLANGEPFYRLEISDENSATGADGLTVDTEGYVYAATRLGLQVCDQQGRVAAVLAKPQNGPLSNAVFGGPDLQTLYVTAGDKVFKRRTKRQGVTSWAAVKPGS
jgi:gluconolactonase